jgi:hypothetical protein
MSESPYAVPVEDFLRTTRVPTSEQVVEQAVPAAPPVDWSSGVPDGDGCDADGGE